MPTESSSQDVRSMRDALRQAKSNAAERSTEDGRKKRRRPPALPEKKERRKKKATPESVASLQPLQNLFFEVKRVVEGLYSGRHRSPFKGASPEFIEYRAYAPGDPVDSIDWKAYARTDRDMIRLTEKETDLTATLLVDGSASMSYYGRATRADLKRLLRSGRVDDADRPESKYQYARRLAGALAFLLVKQSDKVSLGIFADRLRASLPSGGSFPHLYRLLHSLEEHVVQGETELEDSLRQCRHLLKRRGILVIISDFYVEPEDLFGALYEYRHRGFEIVLLHVLHPDELDLPNAPNAQFVGLEGGDRLNVSVDDLREAYRKEMAGHVEALRKGARSRGVDYVLCRTDQPCELVLRDYIVKRGAVR